MPTKIFSTYFSLRYDSGTFLVLISLRYIVYGLAVIVYIKGIWYIPFLWVHFSAWGILSLFITYDELLNYFSIVFCRKSIFYIYLSLFNSYIRAYSVINTSLIRVTFQMTATRTNVRPALRMELPSESVQNRTIQMYNHGDGGTGPHTREPERLYKKCWTTCEGKNTTQYNYMQVVHKKSCNTRTIISFNKLS